MRRSGPEAALQPRVLKWGIFGAIVMRAIMISAGVVLLQRFTWIVYVFGAILVITGIRMFRVEEAHIDPEKNPLVRLARRLFPITPAYGDQKFFVTRAGGGGHQLLQRVDTSPFRGDD